MNYAVKLFRFSYMTGSQRDAWVSLGPPSWLVDIPCYIIHTLRTTKILWGKQALSLHIERFSSEFRKTKTKSLWPITKDADSPVNQSKLEVVSSFWRETRKTFARPCGCGKTSTPQWRIQTWAKVGGLLDLPLPSAILFLPKIRRVEPPGPSPRSATAPDWMRKRREFSKQLV